MIKANELRIGNWVYVGEKIAIVLEVACNGIMYDLFDGSLVSEFCEYEYISPVTITKELIDGFNLGEGRDWLYRKSDGLYSIPIKETSLNLDCFGDVWYEKEVGELCFYLEVVKLYHIHSIQNLYFALTGEELTVKPNT